MTTASDRLDDATALPQRDPGDMLGRIRELPEQIGVAWRQAAALRVPKDYREVDRMVVFAMGGSAIGADLLRGLVQLESPAPLIVVRGYDAPAYVDRRTLAIASSYSGDTEETLSAFEAALERGAKPFVATTGGKLLRMAEERNMPRHVFAYAAMPRAAIAYSLMPLLALVQNLGFVNPQDDDVAEAVAVTAALRDGIDMAVPAGANPAKQMALRLHGRIPVVYGAEFLTEVARRWRGQLAENGKTAAFSDELPELNHNTVVGYPNPAALKEHGVVVMLRSPALHPRILLRYEATRDLLAEAGIRSETVSSHGSGPLAQTLGLVLFGDYVSFYLALLNGADPTEVDVIARLKRRLAEA